MFADAIEAILQATCTPAIVRSVESYRRGASEPPHGSGQVLDRDLLGPDGIALWRSVADNGFLELLAAEADGGAALALPALFPVLCVFGRHAAPLPFAQSIVARALIPPPAPCPEGLITLASSLRRDADGNLACPFTPFGLVADWVLACDGADLLVMPLGAATRQWSGVHGSLTASLIGIDEGRCQRHRGCGAALTAFAAALHAALISGAIGRAFELSLQYCGDRSQFGRSLDKFQAIQHQLSVMAEHTAAASMAAAAAFQTDAPVPTLLAAALAKSRTSEAAGLIASTAHALHGAIGVTDEYPLQQLTRRLHEWRLAHGSESHWYPWIGQAVLNDRRPLVEFVRTLNG